MGQTASGASQGNDAVKKHIAIWAIATAASALSAPALASGVVPTVAPSFNCAKAVKAAEKAICRDADLATADIAIDIAYRRLLESLDPTAAATLVVDQRRFMAARDRAFQNLHTDRPVEPPIVYLKDRVEVLSSFNVPATEGFIGRWGNAAGFIEISSKDDDMVKVEITTYEPFGGGWLCSATGSGMVSEGALVVKIVNSTAVVRLDREGELMNVQIPRNPYAVRSRVEGSFCTKPNGIISGRYFSVKPPQ